MDSATMASPVSSKQSYRGKWGGVVPMVGIGPTTPGLGNRRSIPLSYKGDWCRRDGGSPVLRTPASGAVVYVQVRKYE